MRNRNWFPVPTYAVRVIVGIAQEQSLDLLCETVLRLLRIRAWTPEEIETAIGLKFDLIASALAELVDENLARKSEGGTYLAVDTQLEFPGRDLRSAWAFFCPHNNDFLPRIWIGDKLPSSCIGSGEVAAGADQTILQIDEASYPKVSLPEHSEVVNKLKKLTVDPELIVRKTSDLRTTIARQANALQDFPNFEFSNFGELKVRSITVDSTVNIYREGRVKTVTWGIVQFLPGFDSSVTSVFYRPEILPGEYATTLKLERHQQRDSRLQPWIAMNWLELNDELENSAKLAKEENSDVLKLANLDPEKFDRIRKEHWNSRLKENNIRSFSESELVLTDELKYSQGKLLLWRAHPSSESLRDAFYAHEHAIEVLAKSLRQPVVEQILDFGSRFKAMSKAERSDFWQTHLSEEMLSKKFKSLGLFHLVSDSFKHLAGNLSSVKNVLSSIEKIEKDKLGAGASFLVWLLPLAFFDEDKVLKHIARIRFACEFLPSLSKEIDYLIQIRNSIAHHRDTKEDELPPDLNQLDERLFAVAAAMFGVQ